MFSHVLMKAEEGCLTLSENQNLARKNSRRRGTEIKRKPRARAVTSFLLFPIHTPTGSLAWQYVQPSTTTCGRMNLGMSRLVSDQGMLSAAYVSPLAQHAENAGLIQIKIAMCGIVPRPATTLGGLSR